MKRTGGRWRATRIVLLACAILHLLYVVSLPTGFLNPLFIEANEGLKQASDFFGIYQAGANLASGHSIYDSDDYRNEAPRRVPFFYFYRYLPPTACLFAPVTLVLPPWPAYWLWILACEAILLLLVRSVLRQREWPRSRRYLVAALWLGFLPFYLEQIMGQFSIVMAAFLWMLWRYDAGRLQALQPAGAPEASPGPLAHAAAQAGIVLRRWRGYRWREDQTGGRGLALGWIGSLSLKSFAALLFVPYLRDRRLKLLLAGTGATIALSAPYFLARPADLREFLRLNLLPFTPSLHKGSFGLHNLLRDLLARIDAPALTRSIEVGPVELRAAGLVLLLVFALIGITALFASLRLLDHPNRVALDLTIWTTAFFLIFKSVWEYHYVMLLPSIGALYLTTGSRFVLGVGILLALPTLYPLAPALAGVEKTSPIETWPGWFSALHLSVKSLPTLALFGWSVRQAGRTFTPRAEE